MSARRRARAWIAGAAGALLLAALAFAAGVVWWSGAALRRDPSALARIEVQPLGGSLVSAQAFDSRGHRIPLSVRELRLWPRRLVSPGEGITVVAVIRRPTWIAWAAGKTRVERLTVRAPVTELRGRWLSAARGAPVRLRFTGPVAKLAYTLDGRRHIEAGGGRRAISLEPTEPSGTVEVASAARRWERLGAPEKVTWFPVSRLPVVLVSPGPRRAIPPRTPIRLTFSRPLADAIGSATPQFSPHVPGRWRVVDDHTLAFLPSRLGFPFDANVRLELPRQFTISSGTTTAAAQAISWRVSGASFLRLQQLLATAGYLPLRWQPKAAPPPRELRAQLDAAVAPPAGRFVWSYPNTPPELQRLWVAGRPNEITRGAVMMFEDEHGLDVDGLVGPRVWQALLRDTIAGKRRTDGYSYVFVHRNVPQRLTLWHNGSIVLTSPGNTGVPVAPTELGTFPVFEHIPIGTMSGTNPDGSHYNDPGIRWISYFHGGEALHAFNRASFGTPQSLGCVELPLATAARVWPYTPIGTLVTIEP